MKKDTAYDIANDLAKKIVSVNGEDVALEVGAWYWHERQDPNSPCGFSDVSAENTAEHLRRLIAAAILKGIEKYAEEQ